MILDNRFDKKPGSCGIASLVLSAGCLPTDLFLGYYPIPSDFFFLLQAFCLFSKCGSKPHLPESMAAIRADYLAARRSSDVVLSSCHTVVVPEKATCISLPTAQSYPKECLEEPIIIMDP